MVEEPQVMVRPHPTNKNRPLAKVASGLGSGGGFWDSQDCSRFVRACSIVVVFECLESEQQPRDS
jgi:hypothetical protein